MIALLLLSVIPYDDAREVRCGCTELNHVYADGETQTIEQVIWWDQGDCRDWRLTSRSGKPKYDHQTGSWITRWIEDGQLIEVKSRTFREVWSVEDREIVERDYWPQEKRRKLR